VMDSRSTLLPAGFGGHLGRALQPGDALPCEPGAGEVRLLRASPPSGEPDAPLRVVAGPQAGLFDDTGLAAFFAGTYRVDASSDRRGLRLTGPAVTTHARVELASQGVLPGVVQIPPDGRPIILGWDGPVTGGYPVIAGVIAADLPRLAQLRPGDAVRFIMIELEAARELAAAHWKFEELG